MKKLVVSALTACAASLLAACAQPQGSSSSTPPSSSAPGSSSASQSEPVPSDSYSPPKPVKLEYWISGTGPERTQVYLDRIDEFNKLDPNLQVEGVYIDNNKMQEKLNVAIDAKATPDSATIADTVMAGIFVTGSCVELDDMFAQWSDKDQYPQNSIDSIRQKTASGKLYAIPHNANLTGIWFRKDVFAEKGVEAPTSWDAFFTAAKELTYQNENDQPVYGFTMRGGSGSVNQLLLSVVSYVGEPDFFDEQGKAQVLRSSEAADFVGKFADIYLNKQAPESSLTAGFKEMVADFNAEVAMMMIHNLGSYENQKETFSPEQYAYTPFPPAVTGKYASVTPNCKGMVLFTSTVDTAAGWEFMKFFCSDETTSITNQSIGEMPARRDTMQRDWVQSAPHLAMVIPFVNDDEVVTVSIPNYLPDYNSINTTILEPEFQKLLSGGLAVEDFMDLWATEYEKAYAEYAANN